MEEERRIGNLSQERAVNELSDESVVLPALKCVGGFVVDVLESVPCSEL
jgi:hypothetical protein